MSGPLAGVRVLDLSSVVVGPVATAALAEAGARGDQGGKPGGRPAPQPRRPGPYPGMSGKFLNFNRGKRSLCLDLKKPAARAALRRLTERADVLVTNMRPEAQARLGVDAPTLTAALPRLIHCSIVGFASGGPYEGKPAYDTVIQGVSGVAGCFEASIGEPRYVPMLIADHVCGLIAAQAVGFALYRREKTGRGEAIEVPMFENMAAFVLMEHLGPATFRPPLAPPGDMRVLSPEARPIPTKDGYICLSANTDAQAHAFFDAIGRPELKTDPDFCHRRRPHRQHRALFRPAGGGAENPHHRRMASHLRRRRCAGDALQPHRRPAARIRSCAPSGLVQEGEHPTEGPVVRIGAANRFSGGNAPPLADAPRLGADGPAVLAEAGFSEAEIAALRSEGALSVPEPSGGTA